MCDFFVCYTVTMIPHPQLEVITGCMSSGKTEELIRRLNRAHYAGIESIVFRPSIDTRSGSELCSRNGRCIRATYVRSSEEIPSHLSDAHTLVAIDEAQFFDMGLVPIVMDLVRSGRWVIVSGLDLDYKEAPFQVMAELIVRAHPVTKLTAVCMKCKGNNATRSQRLVHSDARFLVGDKEYEPRCLNCFELPVEARQTQEITPLAQYQKVT